MPDLAYPLHWLWMRRRQAGLSFRKLLPSIRDRRPSSLDEFGAALRAGRPDRADQVLASILNGPTGASAQRDALLACLLWRIVAGDGWLARRLLR